MDIKSVDIARLRAFDLETHKTTQSCLAPPIVVGSMATVGSDGSVRGELLYPRAVAVATAKEYLESGITIVGANIAYDFVCIAASNPELLPEIFRAYREGRVIDVSIVQTLDAIAGGHLGEDPRTGGPLRNPSTGEVTTRYALATVLDLVTGRTDAKESAAWRMSYALLEDVELKHWPANAKKYPVDDTLNTLIGALGQLHGWYRGRTDPERGPARNFNNAAFQAEAAFCLHLGAAWGLRTDHARVALLSAKVEALHKIVVERYQKLGWIRENGTEDTAAVKRDIVLAYGANPLSRCSRCKGTGKIRNVKEEDCRGEKVRGRFVGCVGATCTACVGAGKIGKLGNEVTCQAGDGGCDGTGLDVRTAKNLKRTKTFGIATDRDVKMESGNEDLSDFGEDEVEKVRSTYLPYLRRGISGPLTLKPNVLLYTGRVSYGDPIQQFPRKGGVRNCVMAREGYYLSSTDYAAGELCTLAQICIWTVGYSAMATIINETKDPGSLHTKLASQMMGVPFDEARALVKAGDKRAKEFRQASKAGMFGLPGGMGAATFVLAKRKSSEGFTHCPDGPSQDKDGNAGFNGIRFCVLIGGADYCGKVKITTWKTHEYAPVCEACVRVVENILKPAFFSTYPEVKKYLYEYVSGRVDIDGRVPCLGWNKTRGEKEILRVRGGCNFTAGANTGFQALLSDVGKLAFIRATRECYLGTRWDGGGESPLAGSRLPVYQHDEPIGEHPIPMAHLAAPRVADIMCESGRELAPDVFWKAEPALMKWWDKDAAPVHDESGKLVLWTPDT